MTRYVVREGKRITAASSVLLVTRATSLDVPDLYEAVEGDVTLKREPLSPELASLIERARQRGRAVTVGVNDPLASMLRESVTAATIELDNGLVALIIGGAGSLVTPRARGRPRFFRQSGGRARAGAPVHSLSGAERRILRGRSELQNRSDVIRDIVYALAHDLRTPLVAADVTMKSSARRRLWRAARALQADSRDDARVDGESAPFGRNAIALVARYESGEDSHRSQREEIGPLIERISAELQPVARAKGVELRVQPIPANAVIDADEDEIGRALTNLVANAIEATPAEGSVNVESVVHDGVLTVTVIDDGYGVPPERRGGTLSTLCRRTGGWRDRSWALYRPADRRKIRRSRRISTTRRTRQPVLR